MMCENMLSIKDFYIGNEKSKCQLHVHGYVVMKEQQVFFNKGKLSIMIFNTKCSAISYLKEQCSNIKKENDDKVR